MKRLMLLFMVIGFVCTVQATVIVETFDFGDTGSKPGIDSGGASDSETPVTMTAGTGFSWGAKSAELWAHKSANLQSKSAVASDYAYTIMDSTGGNWADTAIDLTGGQMSVTWKTSDGDAGIVAVASIQLIVRNGAGNWYLSDTVFTTAAESLNQIDVLTIADSTWKSLGNTADMDELDAGGEQILTIGAAAIPTLSAVDGMGYYYTTDNDSSKQKLLVSNMELNSIPEPATVILLGLGGLVLRRRGRMA